MISRIWHGYTTRENADSYENLLKEEIFVGIGERRISGYQGIQLFRRDIDDEVEFITVMWFDSLDAVRVFLEMIMRLLSCPKKPGLYSNGLMPVHSTMKLEAL